MANLGRQPDLVREINNLKREIEEIKRSNLLYTTGSGFRRSSNKVIPSGTWTTIELDTLLFGDAETLSSGMIKIPKDGIYLTSSQINWGSNTSGTRFIAIVKSPSTRFAVTQNQAESNFWQEATSIIRLSKGDTVQLQCYQNSGSNVDAISSSVSPALSVQYLSPIA